MALFKSIIWKGMFTLLLLIVLSACGGNNNSDAVNKSVSADENHVENENEQMEIEGDEIELPEIFPGDYPIPEPAILGIFKDDVEDAILSVNTPMSLDDLESLYDPFFDQYDDFSKHSPSDDQEYPTFSYTVDNEDVRIIATIVDRGEHRSVHTSVHRK